MNVFSWHFCLEGKGPKKLIHNCCSWPLSMDLPVSPLMAQVISCKYSLCGVISLSHLLYLGMCHTLSVVLIVRFILHIAFESGAGSHVTWQTALCQPEIPGGSWTGHTVSLRVDRWSDYWFVGAVCCLGSCYKRIWWAPLFFLQIPSHSATALSGWSEPVLNCVLAGPSGPRGPQCGFPSEGTESTWKSLHSWNQWRKWHNFCCLAEIWT